MNFPTHLTDPELVEGLARCVRGEREATVKLVAYLAEMDARQLHLGAGFPSLFAYCCEVLRLSESATYKRIEVARASRRYPAALDRLADGSLNLSTARLLAPHLTRENHLELMAAATGLGKRAVEELVARRFPRPDLATSIRRVSGGVTAPSGGGGSGGPEATHAHPPESGASQASPHSPEPGAFPAGSAHSRDGLGESILVAGRSPISGPPRPLAVPLSADRYRIAFTASAATLSKLRQAQDLLRHAVPNGDPAEIVDRALTLLLADLARRKSAEVATPVARPRPAAAKPSAPGGASGRPMQMGAAQVRSRHVPAAVKRAVWLRDGGRCAFKAPSGRRCAARTLLEYHHVEPFAAGGATTAGNLELRCRAHNGYEARLFFGEGAFRRGGGSARDGGSARGGGSARDGGSAGDGGSARNDGGAERTREVAP